jgi:ABC-type nickel/cobalt efflux system permease component RcnA
MDLSLVYFPSAMALGALHALEPGHAKTLTAAYLIGIKGTKRDALLLGLSVAAMHSFVVIALSTTALWIGRAAFTEQAAQWLQVASGAVVIALGAWMLWRRWPARLSRSTEHADQRAHAHEQPPNHEHDHASPPGHSRLQRSYDEHDEDAHARQHAAPLPAYVRRGERPTPGQIIAFGAAGGMIPCPASVTVMLLALSIGQVGLGLLTVLGFSLGLALTLVGMGLMVVAGLNRLAGAGRFPWLSQQAPLISAAVVILSGIVALVLVEG